MLSLNRFLSFPFGSLLLLASTGAQAEVRSVFIGRTLQRGQSLDLLRHLGAFRCGDHISSLSLEALNRGHRSTLLSFVRNGREWQRATYYPDAYDRPTWAHFEPRATICHGVHSLGIRSLGPEPLWVGLLNIELHPILPMPPTEPSPPPRLPPPSDAPPTEEDFPEGAPLDPPPPPAPALPSPSLPSVPSVATPLATTPTVANPPPLTPVNSSKPQLSACPRSTQRNFQISPESGASRVLACPSGTRRQSQGHSATDMDCSFAVDTDTDAVRLSCTNVTDTPQILAEFWVECCGQ